MKATTSVSNAARNRVRERADEIVHSLRTIAKGRPGDAEPDETRSRAVVQVRKGVTFEKAQQIARAGGPEAVWGKTIDFVGVAFFELGQHAARSVCRIATRAGQGVGTGFLISPHLLMTNNHVISSASAALGMVAEFDYELDIGGAPRAVTRFTLAPGQTFITDDRDDLDFTVVAVGQRISGPRAITAFGYLPVSEARNKHVLGDIVNIIQHPDGRFKEAVVRENQVVSRCGTVLHYVTDTEPGSSGSPVFNVMWDVVALHHWGGPHRELYDEKGLRVPRTVNEGVRISAIVLDLKTRKATLAEPARGLLNEAMKLGVDNAPAPAHNDEAADRAGQHDDERAVVAVTVAPDGTATWRIPLAVSVRLGGGPGNGTTTPTPPAEPGPATPPDNGPPGGEVRLEIDEDYGRRSGYDPAFLQSVGIPLPKLSSNQKKVAAKNREPLDGDEPTWLRYEHFTIVMNGKRRLAFFSAVNIDGSRSKDVDRTTGQIADASGPAADEDEAAEATELWFSDRRIDDHDQTPPDFYSSQTTIDATGTPIVDRQTSDHRNRMFQQGHLTRRQDPLWGLDEVVIRANADTFHVTNRSPQVGYFNMGIWKSAEEAKKHFGGNLHWRAIEEYVLQNARADLKRVTVFTGPIFDDANDLPWSRGRDDMTGFKVPREYWKLVLRVDHGQLHATALIADQTPLIDFMPELRGVTDEEARPVLFDKVKKYLVSVAELERRTGLDFGPAVAGADTFTSRGGGEAARRLVKNVEDVSFDRPAGNGRARPRRAATRRRAPARPRTKKR